MTGANPPTSPAPPPRGERRPNDDENPVLRDLRRHLTGGGGGGDSSSSSHPSGAAVALEQHHRRSAVALPVAAIKSLLGVIQRTKSHTMMGLQQELRDATEEMLAFARGDRRGGRRILGGRSHIALASGCELFMKYVTRCFLELPDFASCISQVLERGERFANISLAARDRIATSGQSFVRSGATVLTHGWSRVVAALLLKAAQRSDRHFSVVLLEGRPDAGGAKAARMYADAGIPATVVLDSAMGYVMERIDVVIVGAEGVVENGGVVNKIGTYALAVTAHSLGKPFYVAAESYKFARLYPLNQRDLPDMGGEDWGLSFVDTASWEATGGAVGKKKPIENEEEEGADEEGADEEGRAKGEGNAAGGVPGLVELPPHVKVENPPCDYTPAKYITLLFTDLGVLTPSAVSDELIRLYQ